MLFSRLIPRGGRLFGLVLGLLGLLYAALGMAGGYGVDVDIYAMLRTGIDVFHGAGYSPSRTPGYPLPELVSAAAALAGGAILANAVSAMLACVALACFFQLMRRPFGDRMALLAMLAAGLNPYWMLSASMSMDYVYAAAFCLAGLLALRDDKPVLAGVLFAASIASRLTYLPLCVLGAVAFWTSGQTTGRIPARSQAERPLNAASRARWMAGFVLCALGAALAYFPSWKALGSGMFTVTVGSTRVSFFGESGFQSWVAVAGRFLYKNVMLWGIPGAVVLFAGAWGLRGAGSPGRRRSLAALGIALVYVEALFWHLPLEVYYLLPLVFLVPALLAFTRHRVLIISLLIVTQVVQGVVSFDLLRVRYKVNNQESIEASGAAFDPGFYPGPILMDLSGRPAAQQHQLKYFGLEELAK